MLGGGEEVGVAPDAPLAVGAAAEGGEDVAGVLADFAAFDGGEGDFEEVPADGEIAADGDLLHVGAALERGDLHHGAKCGGELVAAHGRAAWGEEDDVVGHEVELRGEVAGGGGFAPGVDEGADLLVVLLVSVGLAHFFSVLLEGGEDDVFGEELGQDVGGGVYGRGVDDVGGDAAAVDGGELLGDLGVVLGPVGSEEGDVVFAELVLDVGGLEDEALVDLAAEAPGGGEVDEDGMAGGAGLVEGLLGVGRPDEGGVFGLVERDGEADGGDEDCGDGAGPAGGPFAEDPAGDGEHQEAAEEESDAVDALAAAGAACEERAVDVDEPDDGREEDDGGELLEDLHPCAGTREDAGPCGLEAEEEIGCGESEGERGEDGEGDGSGLGEGEADGCSHERRGAGSGDDGGEDSGEEAAGVALLLREIAADAGEGEADVEEAGEREGEEEDACGEEGEEDGGLELEAPSGLAAAGAEGEEDADDDPEGDEDAEGVDEAVAAEVLALLRRRTAGGRGL